MGQQQLLLVILVTIIVGIATVVAINTFGTAADSANIDAVRQDVAQLASAAQGYYLKPAALGGGSRSFQDLTFYGLAFPAAGIRADSLGAQNENGYYVITGNGVASQTLTITAHPSSGEGYTPGAIVAGILTPPANLGDQTIIGTVVPNNVTISAP